VRSLKDYKSIHSSACLICKVAVKLSLFDL